MKNPIKTKEKKFKLQGSYKFQGLPISVENKAGSERTGTDKDGKKWSTKMLYDYGFIRNTEATDGEGVDAFINRENNGKKENYHKKEGEPEMVDTDIHVVHQKQGEKSKKWPNGICPDCHKHHTECKCPQYYDEDKVMLGFESKEAAIEAYLKHYDSPRFLGPVSTYSLREFKQALRKMPGKKLPYVNRKHEHWTGVDLDGTLAKDDGWKGKDHIGEPVEKMRERIMAHLDKGDKVKLLTARASDPRAIPPIKQWMKENNIPILEITNKKDPGMINLYDDRATQVKKNTGQLVKSISQTYYVDLDKAFTGTDMENILPVFFTVEDLLEDPEGYYEEYGKENETKDDFLIRMTRKIRDMEFNRATEYHVNKDRRIFHSAHDMPDLADVVLKSCGKVHEMDKSYLGQEGDPHGSRSMLRENLDKPYYVYRPPTTMSGMLDEIEKSYPDNAMDGESADDYFRRMSREHSNAQVRELLEKAFVRVPAHTRAGKHIPEYHYITDRSKKIADVRHQTKTRVDYGKKEADAKIADLHKKKQHHEMHIQAANDLKEKVESDRKAGKSTYKIGDKEHNINKVLKDLNDHIKHHVNEKKSHDNHIQKIQDRHKTEQAYWDKKKEERNAKQQAIDELIKDGKHKGEEFEQGVMDVLEKMKEEEKLKQLEEERQSEYWNFSRRANSKPGTKEADIAEQKVKMGKIVFPWQLPFDKAKLRFRIPEKTYIKHVNEAIKNGKPVSEEVKLSLNKLENKSGGIEVKKELSTETKNQKYIPKPNHVYREVVDFDGNIIDTISVPYDGTKEGAKKAANTVTEKMYNEFDGASNINSRLVATGGDAKPKWAISPNFEHIAEIGTPSARYIYGDTSEENVKLMKQDSDKKQITVQKGKNKLPVARNMDKKFNERKKNLIASAKQAEEQGNKYHIVADERMVDDMEKLVKDGLFKESGRDKNYRYYNLTETKPGGIEVKKELPAETKQPEQPKPRESKKIEVNDKQSSGGSGVKEKVIGVPEKVEQYLREKIYQEIKPQLIPDGSTEEGSAWRDVKDQLDKEKGIMDLWAKASMLADDYSLSQETQDKMRKLYYQSEKISYSTEDELKGEFYMDYMAKNKAAKRDDADRYAEDKIKEIIRTLKQTKSA